VFSDVIVLALNTIDEFSLGFFAIKEVGVINGNPSSMMRVISANALRPDLKSSLNSSQLTPHQITNDTIAEHLYSSDLPDPDLLICTSGGFYATQKHWPNLRQADFVAADRLLQKPPPPLRRPLS